jgi:hypothetical protein
MYHFHSHKHLQLEQLMDANNKKKKSLQKNLKAKN